MLKAVVDTPNISGKVKAVIQSGPAIPDMDCSTLFKDPQISNIQSMESSLSTILSKNGNADAQATLFYSKLAEMFHFMDAYKAKLDTSKPDSVLKTEQPPILSMMPHAVQPTPVLTMPDIQSNPVHKPVKKTEKIKEKNIKNKKQKKPIIKVYNTRFNKVVPNFKDYPIL